ncbi:WD40-repeat-containing domain protein [Dichotomocladium elegans]|nr:WD40-repeat-containing domain protein [Dichotomocladium elegans]
MTSAADRDPHNGSLMTRSHVYSTQLLGTARDKAVGLASAATAYLSPSSLPDWTAPLSHLESLTTVMLNPLAAHPVYQSESLARALQLMQQQQRSSRSSGSSSSGGGSGAGSSSNGNELVLRNETTANQPWPSSAELLKVEIPESHAPLSLFQGFAATYPSLAGAPSSPGTPRKAKHRRKKQQSSNGSVQEGTKRSLTQIMAEREQKMREKDKLEKQKSSTTNEINQVTMQIEELVSKRKALETKWAKLELKEQQLFTAVEQLNEEIIAMEEEGREGSEGAEDRATNVHHRQRQGAHQVDTDSEEEPLYESGTCYKTLTGHDDDVLCVDFNHPRGILVSSSLDDTVRVWDLYKHRCLGILEGHTSTVRCLQLSDATLLTGAEDGAIKLWNLSSIPPAPTPSSISSASVTSSSAPSSPSLTATTADDNTAPLNVLTDCCTGTLDGHQAEVTALFMDRNTAVSGSNDKTMRQWDLETQKCVLTLDVMWASNSAGAASTSSWRSAFDQWSLDGLHSFFDTGNDFVGALQFWNFALASGTMDGKVRMWDLRTGQAHRTLPGHTGPITCLHFDDVHLVSGSRDKAIRIWDLRTGSVFETLNFPSPVNDLQFDSARIVSANCSENIDASSDLFESKTSVLTPDQSVCASSD